MERKFITDTCEEFVYSNGEKKPVMLISSALGSGVNFTLDLFAKAHETNAIMYKFPVDRGMAFETSGLNCLIQISKQLHRKFGEDFLPDLPPGLEDQAVFINKFTQNVNYLDLFTYYNMYIKKPLVEEFTKRKDTVLTIIVCNPERCSYEKQQLLTVLLKWWTVDFENISKLRLIVSTTCDLEYDLDFANQIRASSKGVKIVTNVKKPNEVDSLILDMIILASQNRLKNKQEAFNTEDCMEMTNRCQGSVAFAKLILHPSGKALFCKTCEEAIDALFEPWMSVWFCARMELSDLIKDSFCSAILGNDSVESRELLNFLLTLEDEAVFEWIRKKREKSKACFFDGHERLSKISTRFWKEDEYCIRNGAYHAICIGDYSTARMYVLDAARLVKFFEVGGVGLILNDFDLYFSAGENNVDDISLRMVMNALFMGQKALKSNQNVCEFVFQVLGRLSGIASRKEVESNEEAIQWNRYEVELSNLTRAMQSISVQQSFFRPLNATLKKSNDLLFRTVRGHSDTILGLHSLVLRDRTVVATGSMDGTCKLWDALSGKCLCTMATFGGGGGKESKSVPYISGVCLALSEGGVIHCLCSCSDAVARLFFISSDDFSILRAKRMEGHEDTLNACKFFGVRLAVTGSMDGTVRVWKLPTCDEDAGVEAVCTHVFGCNKQPVYSVAFLNERLVIAGSKDGGCRVFEVMETGDTNRDAVLPEGLLINNHITHVTSISLSPNQSKMATCGWDCCCNIWEFKLESGEGLGESENSMWLDSGTERICFTQVNTLVLSDWVWSVSWINEESVVTASDDGVLRVFALATSEVMFILDVMENSAIYSISVCMEQSLMFCGGNEITWKIFTTNKNSLELQNPSLIKKVSITKKKQKQSSNGKDTIGVVSFGHGLIYTSFDESGTIRVFSVSNGRLAFEVNGLHKCKIISIEVEHSPYVFLNGEERYRIKSQDVKNVVKFWDFKSGELQRKVCSDFLYSFCGLTSLLDLDSNSQLVVKNALTIAFPNNQSISFDNKVNAWVSSDGTVLVAIEILSRDLHVLKSNE